MINSEAEYNQMLSDNNEYQYNKQREMKTPMQELMEYMEQNQYFIGNDLLAKYKELIEKEKQEFISCYIRAMTKDYLNPMPRKYYYEPAEEYYYTFINPLGKNK